MDISKAYQSRYLKSSDLDGEVTRTIATVGMRLFRNDEAPKPVVKFTEGRPMVLNQVNARRIMAAYGTDTEDWVGKQITIYVDHDVTFGNDVVAGLRVRIPGNADGASKAKPGRRPPTAEESAVTAQRPLDQDADPLDDEIPF